MDIKRVLVRAMLLAPLVIAGTAGAAGDAKRGADVFIEECGDCHSSVAGKNKKGPSLQGIMGRKAGTLSQYDGYSEAIKQTDWAWSPEKVDVYITQPRKVIPGGKMKYDGLDQASARADVIAYLLSLK